MVDRLLGDGHPDAGCQRLTGTQVTAPARMCPAGNLQTQPMSPAKKMGRGPHIDLDPQALIWPYVSPAWFNPEQPIADVDRTPIWLDVAQPTEEIGVGQT